ncbi:MAG: hypothetical protein ACXVQR_02145 [Solirubrobacteraceae bacterium]
MTPPAATTAGRGTTVKRPGTAGAAGGHRRKLWRGAAPKAPRRVSGPQQGRVAGSTAAPARPRQTPIPARPRPAARRRARPARTAPLSVRALAFVQSLPDRALVDRLVRGRAWIPLLGVMLAGIVAMQVELLKLNSTIGHGIDRSATLQSQNEQLRASVAGLADDQRIEGLAAKMGMIMPSPDNVVFVAPRGGTDVQQALGAMRPPDASALATMQAAQPSSAQSSGSQSSSSGSGSTSSSSGSTESGSSSTSTAGSGTLGVSMPSSSSSALASSSSSQSGSSTATGN